MESVISAYCPIPHHLAVWSTKYTWFQFPNNTSNLRFEIQLNTFHQDDLNSAFLFKICIYIPFCAVFSMFYAGKLAKMYQLRGTNQLSGFKTSSFYHSLCLYGSAVEYSNIYPTSVWLSNCNTTKMRR